MEEEKIHNKNKFIITLICMILIILLVIGSLFLGKYISYEENKDNNEVNNQGESSEVVESVMPTDKEFILQYYWSFEDLYNYYVNPKDNGKSIVINENFGFVKIENNKLMWNVNNAWVNDSLISEDIKAAVFDYKDTNFDKSLFGVIVTNNNLVYTITIDESLLKENYISTITDDIYNNIKYSEFENKMNIDIDYMLPRLFSECEIWTNYYFISDNRIYILNYSENTLIEYDPKNSNNILTFADTCGNIIFDFTWDLDSYLEEIKDYSDNLIKATHIMSVKNDNIDYIFIIDDNKNLYSIKLEDLVNCSKLKPYKKIEKMSYSYDNNSLEIEFVGEESLVIN